MPVNSKQLLSDLTRLVTALEKHLRERCDEAPKIEAALQAEYDRAFAAKRTALTYEKWREGEATQTAVAWVLSCVFVRFLEDNELIDPPLISGPGDRLKRARDESTLYFEEQPNDSDREYLQSVFKRMGELPGARELFGKFNPVNDNTNWIGVDFVRTELLPFFRKIDGDSGKLEHDFTDPDWQTRFLGDLYQDLSEAARKKYALLQTPDFVEEFILDRTLDPALDEFGLVVNPEFSNLNEEQPDRQLTRDDVFRMIDPACGSGHFLLGAFERIFERWSQKAPTLSRSELAQRALLSIHGVDINPFAIAIARFRLLLAALAASGVRRLADAPAFAMNLACGDSLYHGRGEYQRRLDDEWTDESHYFRTEDAEHLRRILQEGTFHAVVANPPYIVPKDRAANAAYRRLYSACHMKYSLSVPFMERIFRLAASGEQTGYTGQITSNSFMKREFGKKLVEKYFPTVDLTHVLDTQLAHIPGHATATVIVFGRSRLPVTKTVRMAAGLRREMGEPLPARDGKVWQALMNQVDNPEVESVYMRVRDTPRSRFLAHPLLISGDGAAELKEQLHANADNSLHEVVPTIGPASFAGVDDAFVASHEALRRIGINAQLIRPFAGGDQLRDWSTMPEESCLTPYCSSGELLPLNDSSPWARRLWRVRRPLESVTSFGGKTRKEMGDAWWSWYRWIVERVTADPRIAFAFVATHNHFVLDTGSVFNRSAPVLKPASELSARDVEKLLAILNASTLQFWMRQVFFCKGGGGNGRGVSAEAYERMLEYDATKLKELPLVFDDSVLTPAIGIARALKILGSRETVFATISSGAIFGTNQVNRETIGDAVNEYVRQHNRMIRLQEDLDWECYRLYGLLEDDLTYGSCQSSVVSGQSETEDCELKTDDSDSFGIALGERAFEIVMARKMAAGELTTTWFERHGSQPITELPSHWPDDYRQLVQRRIDIIESNPQVALIEQPEYKRRWNTKPWEKQVETALKTWLLNRLEDYFDFDGRMMDVEDSDEPPSSNPQCVFNEFAIINARKLGDAARNDDQFREVAEVYLDKPDVDYETLVEELIADESVPLLPVLRYKQTGLDNRSAWERTWELQRLEDTIDARVKESAKPSAEWKPEADSGEGPLTHEQADRLKQHVVGEIPVPPKYKSKDFQKTTYWKLRGKLDVPKERWVSFPHCEGDDGSPVIAWAGYDHLQLTEAVANYYTHIRENVGGREDPRLVPLLACVLELLPWVKQWHNEIDPEYRTRAGDEFEGFLKSQLRDLGLEEKDLREWEPPKKKKKRKKK